MPGIMNIVARGPYREAQDDPEEPLEGLQRGAGPQLTASPLRLQPLTQKFQRNFRLSKDIEDCNDCNTQCQIIN